MIILGTSSSFTAERNAPPYERLMTPIVKIKLLMRYDQFNIGSLLLSFLIDRYNSISDLLSFTM